MGRALLLRFDSSSTCHTKCEFSLSTVRSDPIEWDYSNSGIANGKCACSYELVDPVVLILLACPVDSSSSLLTPSWIDSHCPWVYVRIHPCLEITRRELSSSRNITVVRVNVTTCSEHQKNTETSDLAVYLSLPPNIKSINNEEAWLQYSRNLLCWCC